MSEGDWFRAEGAALLVLAERLPSERKKRLLACALARLTWRFLSNARSREAIECSERYADGQEDKTRLKEIRRRSASVARGSVHHWKARHWAADVATMAASVDIAAYFSVILRHTRQAFVAAEEEGRLDERTTLLVRDIFGDPFRTGHVDPAWLAWREGTIPKIAAAVYEDRDFERLPILADALEEAGCADANILTHCRSAGTHVRGCWVVDLLLGKT